MTSNLLIDAALRSLLLAGVIQLALGTLRPRNARLRVAAWTLVLLAALAMPLLAQWRIFQISTPAAWTRTADLKSPHAGRESVRTGQIPTPLKNTVSHAQLPLARLAWAGYGLVSAILLLRVFMGVLLTARTWRRAKPIDASWAGAPAVREAGDVTAPAATGSGILFPNCWRAWEQDKLRAVLAHERAHVAHGDFYVRLLARVYAALFWFSPLGWWLSHELSELQEQASDDEALALFPDRSTYAEVLLFFAQRQQRSGWTLAMARTSTVSRRVERVLALSTAPARANAAQYGALAMGIVGAALLVAGCSVRAQSPPPATPAKESTHENRSAFWMHSGDDGEPYVIVSGDGLTMSGSSSDAASARSLRKRYADDYLWFLREGKSYVITDAPTLRRAKDLFRDQAELGRKESELGEQQEKLGAEQEKLGVEQSLVAVPLPDLEAETRELGQQLERERGSGVAEAREALRGLEAELKEHKSQSLTQEQLSEIQERVSALQERLADSHADLESKLGEIQSRFGELQNRAGDQQSKLGERQSELGEKQAALGEEQARLADKASKELRKLIDEAVRGGRATPVQ